MDSREDSGKLLGGNPVIVDYQSACTRKGQEDQHNGRLGFQIKSLTMIYINNLLCTVLIKKISRNMVIDILGIQRTMVLSCSVQ